MTLKSPKEKGIHKNILLKGNRFFLILIVLLLGIASCTPHKNIVYLQRQAEAADTIASVTPDYRIQPGDILNIQVLTPDEKSYTTFNSDRTGQRSVGGGGIGNVQMFLHGYNVDHTGHISMPVVGEVNVGGKTINEATKMISGLVADYLIGATVLVKLVNFSVTVIGEVGSPGKFYIYDNKINIIDIIAQAGDLTDFGNRNITIVRQTPNGATFGELNLNDANIIASEYYYMHPNDIIYVEPYKIKRLGFSQFPFGLVFSTISTTLLLINFFSN
ncbi:MAG: polysaccharide biosynthesis/export family protein [Bacteroidota bacterium]